jgi:alkylation response protein AidB-like acyl-CoA dehydrogenase
MPFKGRRGERDHLGRRPDNEPTQLGTKSDSQTALASRGQGDGLAPTDSALVAATVALGGGVRRHIEEGERERRLPAATADALRDAGLFRLCRARELGGLAADPMTVIEVVEELARHDGSAAWCALNCGIAGVLQSFLAGEGAAEIGDAPDVVLNGVIAPTGRAVEVDGGYRVSGRWSFVSNCHHCTWLALSCVVVTGDGPPTSTDEPRIVMTFVPASQWQVVDTWHTVGMRATGSHDIELSDVFVPACRVIAMPPTAPVRESALARFPLVGLFAVGMAACAIGLAGAALDELVELAQTKTPFGLPSALATRPSTQIAVSQAIAETRSARSFLVQEAHEMWQVAQNGTVPTAEQRALLRIAATHATAAATAAADLAYTAAGSSAIFESSPLQRHLRDIHTLTQHFFVAAPTNETTGKVLLGVEPDGFML